MHTKPAQAKCNSQLWTLTGTLGSYLGQGTWAQEQSASYAVSRPTKKFGPYSPGVVLVRLQGVLYRHTYLRRTAIPRGYPSSHNMPANTHPCVASPKTGKPSPCKAAPGTKGQKAVSKWVGLSGGFFADTAPGQNSKRLSHDGDGAILCSCP